MLNLILGLTDADSGKIIFDGKNIHKGAHGKMRL